jgi:putative ABC transport system permease protein
VLLIAGLNVGNLALSRAAVRRPELAVRLSLGARPWRIGRLLVAECLVLAAAAAILGLVLGRVYLALLRGLAPPQTPRLDSIRLDGAVVAATFAIALAAGLLAGLLPAAWSLRRPFALLREATGATPGRRSPSSRGVLVVVQIAASALLLSGAGILLRTLVALARVDPGFRTEKLVVGRLTVRPAHPPAVADVTEFMARLEARLRERPEIAAVGEMVPQPLADRQFDMGFTLEGQSPAVEDRQSAVWRWASPGTFQAFGVQLAEGRLFGAADDARAPLVALVNERFVARFLGGRNALGRRLRSVIHDGPEAPWRRIVGVLRDLRGKLDQPPEPEIYLPLFQDQGPEATIVARASGSPAAALEAMQAVASELRPGQVVARRETLEAALDRGLSPRRFAAGVVGTFAAAALLLAVVGIYGVTALAVSRRQRELAVRLALGARPAAIAGLLLRWMGAQVALGVALGLGGVVAARRALTGLLYGVRPTDAPTLAFVVLLLAVVALAASLRPALRAARMDPSPVLKRER